MEIKRETIAGTCIRLFVMTLSFSLWSGSVCHGCLAEWLACLSGPLFHCRVLLTVATVSIQTTKKPKGKTTPSAGRLQIPWTLHYNYEGDFCLKTSKGRTVTHPIIIIYTSSSLSQGRGQSEGTYVCVYVCVWFVKLIFFKDIIFPLL